MYITTTGETRTNKVEGEIYLPFSYGDLGQDQKRAGIFTGNETKPEDVQVDPAKLAEVEQAILNRPVRG